MTRTPFGTGRGKISFLIGGGGGKTDTVERKVPAGKHSGGRKGVKIDRLRDRRSMQREVCGETQPKKVLKGPAQTGR